MPRPVLFLSVPLARLARLTAACLVVTLLGVPAFAQQQGGEFDFRQDKMEAISKDHVRLVGNVEGKSGDMRISADQVDHFRETHQVVAQGAVVFSQGGNRISADRAEFNTETGLGVFFNASGTTVLGDAAKKDMLGGQEPDIYFYGDRIEKLGPRKYKIVNGGFTTCVQPTPRWNVTSGTVILNIDHYAYLQNAVLRAKGVPVLYLPVLYYPINKEDRATGFLMPSYGSSTLRGFTLSNAFFWAISRSQDATFMHDWFTKRGQGYGTEYRYVRGQGSQGNMRVYRLNEHEATYTDAGGNATTTPARKSFEVRGNLNQQVARGWYARGRVDYFSDVAVQQTYHTDIYDASRSQRSINASLTGAIRSFTLNGAYDRSEYFQGGSNSVLTGGTPRIQVTRGERPLFGSPIYFGVNSEFVRLLKEYRAEESTSESNLSRFDLQPTLRVPFTKLQWLTVNSSVAWRDTYWTRRKDPVSEELLDESISRRYFELQSRLVGPVLNRVWNTPDNGYAEKFKHTVEPSVTIQRTTSVENFDEIVQLDNGDYVLGGTTRVTYGLTNRFLAKRKTGSRAGSAQEFLNIGISQSYYSDDRASQYDLDYSNSFSGGKPSNFSPISVTARMMPTDGINGTARLEYDHETASVRSLSASGQVAIREWLNASGGYSQRRIETRLDGTSIGASVLRASQQLAAVAAGRRAFDGTIAPSYQENSVYGSANLRLPGNRFGGSYAFNYDIHRETLINSRFIGYYNAQCCGFAIEYQSFNYPQFAGVPIKNDTRFNFSFTLAGLGTFSNFFGAFGGGSQR